MKENNIFYYATKELSQDAFICWCINWFNSDKVNLSANRRKLCEMSNKILDKILWYKGISSKDIKNINIMRQYYGIDITIVITTTNSEQYVVIIEDKVQSKLSNKQKENFYINTLLNSISSKYNDEAKIISNKEKLGLLKDITIENIIPIYWKTSKWDEEKEVLKDKIEKNINKEIICIDGIDTLSILEGYVEYSEIVNSFYTSLKENLMINNVINVVDKIIKEEKIKIGTKFSKNYYCNNCFKKLTKKEYNKSSHTSRGGLDITYLNNKIKRKNYFFIDTINYFNIDGKWKNEFKGDNKNLWIESTQEGDLQTKIKYVFLFVKEKDEFGKNEYVFLGLYKLKKIDEENNCRQWERQYQDDDYVSIKEKDLISLVE